MSPANWVVGCVLWVVGCGPQAAIITLMLFSNKDIYLKTNIPEHYSHDI